MIFLKRCHNREKGGFYFTSDISRNFKGGWEDKGRKKPNVYGCAFYDGYLSLKKIYYII